MEFVGKVSKILQYLTFPRKLSIHTHTHTQRQIYQIGMLQNGRRKKYIINLIWQFSKGWTKSIENTTPPPTSFEKNSTRPLKKGGGGISSKKNSFHVSDLKNNYYLFQPFIISHECLDIWTVLLGTTWTKLQHFNIKSICK